MLELNSQKVKPYGLFSLLMLISGWALLYPFFQPAPKSPSKAEPIVGQAQVPDFANYKTVTAKKKAFFAYLLPEINRQNQIVLEQRYFILSVQQKLARGLSLSAAQRKQLDSLKSKYRVADSVDDDKTLKMLLRRVDIIPPELVLVQAANESAWGTSRFARQGFNFFGLWCFKKGCGFVPNDRNEDSQHEVAKFESLEQGVQRYIRNLNRHYAYKELRNIRESLRNNQQEINAESLAMGLTSYSERGHDYIEELISMIRVNRRHMQL